MIYYQEVPADLPLAKDGTLGVSIRIIIAVELKLIEYVQICQIRLKP